jgi:hypothetical protein
MRIVVERFSERDPDPKRDDEGGGGEDSIAGGSATAATTFPALACPRVTFGCHGS